MKLKETILQKIKDDRKFRLTLQATLGVSTNTMSSYIEDNHSRFTELDCLNVITESMNLPLSDVIEGKISKLMAK